MTSFDLVSARRAKYCSTDAARRKRDDKHDFVTGQSRIALRLSRRCFGASLHTLSWTVSKASRARRQMARPWFSSLRATSDSHATDTAPADV